VAESPAEIPNRVLFRAPEVCEIARVQPYVLRSWELEFPDLGVAKAGGPRVYRREDVEQVLRIKQLVFEQGLTLAGARRRIEEERHGRAETPQPPQFDDLIGDHVRERLTVVRRGLRSLLELLSAGALDARAVAPSQGGPELPSGSEQQAPAAAPHAAEDAAGASDQRLSSSAPRGTRRPRSRSSGATGRGRH
jgi:DNA-binding transcriptional MerR regulator